MKETKSFMSFGIAEAGLLFDESNHSKYPVRYYNAIGSLPFNQVDGNSYFVYVYSGNATVKFASGVSAELIKDTYFNTAEKFTLDGADYKAVIIEVIGCSGYYGETGYRAYTTIGGELEEKGRLMYIDGCTDSLLIPPIKKGDPCLNHLHFPPNTVQTPHTHPSHRIGLVVRGEGECVTPFGNLPLVEGCIFVIKEYDGVDKAEGLDGSMYEAGTHKFDTYDSSMDVIAFHPDSDFGAEDTFHPMINRTIVHGVSANSISDIQTKHG